MSLFRTTFKPTLIFLKWTLNSDSGVKDRMCDRNKQQKCPASTGHVFKQLKMRVTQAEVTLITAQSKMKSTV